MENKNKAVLLALLASFLISAGQIFLKFAAPELHENPITWIDFYFITAIIIFIMVFFVLCNAFSYGKLSILYPILSASYIFTFVFAWIFLEEEIGLLKWLGILVIVTGILLIQRNGKNSIRKIY